MMSASLALNRFRLPWLRGSGAPDAQGAAPPEALGAHGVLEQPLETAPANIAQDEAPHSRRAAASLPATTSFWGRLLAPSPPPNYIESDPSVAAPRSGAPRLMSDRFATFLPYSKYDPHFRLFLIDSPDPNKPEGLGFTLELHPQIGASEAMARDLTNLFNTSAPEGTGFQVQMFGSPVIDAALDNIASATSDPDTAENPTQARLLAKLAAKRIDYYRRGTREELFPNFNYRMRNYRCNLSVVVPIKDPASDGAKHAVAQVREQVITTLKQYYLFAYEWDPEDLINYTALILNPHATMAGDHPWLSYDPSRDIRFQIIAADTHAQESPTDIVYDGGGHSQAALRAMSVRSYPSGNFTLNQMTQLLGSSLSTSVGYPCPFLITLGVTLPPYDLAKNTTLMKAARAQQKADSPMAKFQPDLADSNRDWKIAQGAFDDGPGTCFMYHQVLLLCAPEALARAEQSAKSVWRNQRFEITTDRCMQKQALLASLPMLYGPLLQKDLRIAQRVSTKTVHNATNMMPLIAEWAGTPPRAGWRRPTPLLTLFARLGQTMQVDPFANPSGNFNGIVVGTSGSGKSFFLNELTFGNLLTGGRVWILDVGRSYQKLCGMLGGQYIEFTDRANLSLNPFALVKDIDEDMEMLQPVLAQMIYPSRRLDDFEASNLQSHIKSLWYDHAQRTTIDQLAQSLINNCALGGPNPQGDEPDWQQRIAGMGSEERAQYCDKRIRDMGVALFPWTSEGSYGKYFSNGCNIDFTSNFIVLELEELKAKKALQSVVMLLLMYRITQDMYVGDRSRSKVVIIDEAWDLMGQGDAGQFIEAGYRRARKYGGAFWTATQSVEDYFKSPTALAAFENADCTFLLRQKPESIEKLAASGKFVMDEETKRQLVSVKKVEGRYSEVFCRVGDLPATVGRLFPDEFSFVLANTGAEIHQAIRDGVNQGMSEEEEIEAFIAQRRQTMGGAR